jgi:hypothetical protein
LRNQEEHGAPTVILLKEQQVIQSTQKKEKDKEGKKGKKREEKLMSNRLWH